MTKEILVPEMGESVLEATVHQWFKEEGDRVEVGEVLVELETDKVNLEVGAQQAGVLAEIAVPAGEDVKVGEVLGRIEEETQGEKPSDHEGHESEERHEKDPGEEEEQEKVRLEDDGTEKDREDARQERRKVTPVAARLAQDRDVALGEVDGTGADGRVTKADVERYLQEREGREEAAPDGRGPEAGEAQEPEGEQDPVAERAPDQPSARDPEHDREAHRTEDAARAGSRKASRTATAVTGDGGGAGARPESRERMSRRRRTIAERMLAAVQSTAMLTTFNEIDMGAVMDLRERRKEAFRERHGVKLGITSFFVKAAVSALKAFPRLNAEIDGDEIVLKEYYDVGIAIGAEEGLVVPVLRDAGRLSFAEVEKGIAGLAERTRAGDLTIEDLRGGTFTITNGGVFGSMLSTPILNPPQVGILGLHRIEDRPVAREGDVVIRPVMYVALSYDHRIVDGREAVQFLVHVKQLIEDPERMILEG